MRNEIINRVKEEANYMLKTKKTVREVASIFHVSKSTVYKDLQDRLYLIDKELFYKIQEIFHYHINIRHIKGGYSTKQKYLNLS